jgi:hypothetical protein
MNTITISFKNALLAAVKEVNKKYVGGSCTKDGFYCNNFNQAAAVAYLTTNSVVEDSNLSDYDYVVVERN